MWSGPCRVIIFSYFIVFYIIGPVVTSFLAQLILWCLLVIAMLILAIPFILIGTANLWLGLIPGIGLGLLVIILSSAFFGTFASSVWTLGFMQMTGLTGSRAVEVGDIEQAGMGVEGNAPWIGPRGQAGHGFRPADDGHAVPILIDDVDVAGSWVRFDPGGPVAHRQGRQHLD